MTRATPDCLELLEGLLKLNPNDRLRNVSRMFPLQLRVPSLTNFVLGFMALNYFIVEISKNLKIQLRMETLRVVKTNAILFLISMSERGGSDTQRPSKG